mmetsp:Transcript_45294/g.62994  ORF Transcript_45294/g.62994 Transcript_45294/m.62994 type:complete len:91 (+) Transcript_45294:189-461(+)|eukprot:s828_g5.t1
MRSVLHNAVRNGLRSTVLTSPASAMTCRLKRWRSYDGFDNSRALVPSGHGRVTMKSRSLLPSWPACFNAGVAGLRQNEVRLDAFCLDAGL